MSLLLKMKDMTSKLQKKRQLNAVSLTGCLSIVVAGGDIPTFEICGVELAITQRAVFHVWV